MEEGEKSDSHSKFFGDWPAYEEAKGIAAEQKKRQREENDDNIGDILSPYAEEDRDERENDWKNINEKQNRVANLILQHLSTKLSVPIEEVLSVWRDNIIACREQEKRLKQDLFVSLDLMEKFFE